MGTVVIVHTVGLFQGVWVGDTYTHSRSPEGTLQTCPFSLPHPHMQTQQGDVLRSRGLRVKVFCGWDAYKAPWKRSEWERLLCKFDVLVTTPQATLNCLMHAYIKARPSI